MKRLYFLMLLVFVLTLPSMGQKRKDLSTQVSVNYCLPKVGYDVIVTMECVKLIPGPFQHYAEQQLGVVGISRAGEEWRLKQVKIAPRAISDPKQVYTLTTSGEYGAVFLNITPEGFLAGIGNGNTNVVTTEKSVYNESDQITPIDYTRFGLRSTQKEVLDSNFTMMEIEGVMKRIWDPIERYVLKTEQDYVKEITDEIFNIRAKRLELLTKGGATREAIEGLNELEKNYLSLFLGKREPQQLVRVFTFIPEKPNDSTTLFRFSKEHGILSKNNVSSDPYVISLSNVMIPGEAEGSNPRPAASVSYRVPALADLHLSKGNDLILKMRCVVPQLGYIKSFPLDVINNDNIAIEFYPLYGSLKSVSRRN